MGHAILRKHCIVQVDHSAIDILLLDSRLQFQVGGLEKSRERGGGTHEKMVKSGSAIASINGHLLTIREVSCDKNPPNCRKCSPRKDRRSQVHEPTLISGKGDIVRGERPCTPADEKGTNLEATRGRLTDWMAQVLAL